MDPATTNELAELIGQGVLALVALAATILPAWAINIWRKAIATRLVQDAVLWAARAAVARLQDAGDAAIRTESGAVAEAAAAVEERVPEALSRAGVNTQHLRGLVEARVKSIVAGLVPK